MQIGQNPAPALNLTLSTSPSGQQAWQVGQILQATVLSVGQDGALSLRLGSTTVQAQAQFAAAPGQTLALEVVDAGSPPVLRLLAPPTADEVAARATRSALPRQDGLPPLLANLNQLARQGDTQDSSLARLTRLVAQVVDTLPSASKVSSGAGLRQALLDSGLFLERNLAQAQTSGRPPQVSADLKAGLLRLVSLLVSEAGDQASGRQSATPSPSVPAAPQPPLRGTAPQPQANVLPTLGESLQNLDSGELLRQVEAGVARIQLHQLASLATDDRPQPLLSLELPVRQGERTDVFDMRIGKEPGRDPGQSDVWSVTLAFELQNLGPVRARVTVADKQVSVGLWAERAGTAALFERQIETLQTGLRDAGLTVGRLSCGCGTPPEPERPPSTQALFRAKA
jgi:hypothetical protein